MPPRAALAALALFAATLTGFLPVRSERSSSERTPLDAAELRRDTPLYPLLRDTPRNADNPGTSNKENDKTSKISPLSPKSKDFQPFFDTNDFDEDSIDNTDVNEVTGVNYDETETGIEDSSILVTPDETVLENLTKDKTTGFNEALPKESSLNDKITLNTHETTKPVEALADASIKIIDFSKENLFETDVISKSNINPEDYNDLQHVPQILESSETEQNKESVSSETTNGLFENDDFNSGRAFIVAPGSNVDELNNILMAEEARVDSENKRFSYESNIDNVTKASMDEDNLAEAYVTEEDLNRKKRSSTEWDKPPKSQRVKIGDTILNIRGAVRDAIGDAGAAPSMRASSRVDAFVIRPSPVIRDEPTEQMREARRENVAPPQPVKQEKELLLEPHARARLACDLTDVTDLRWYKDSEQVNLPSSPGGGESAWREGDAVEFARASRGHAARWRCAGRDRAGRTVTGEPTRLLIYEPIRSVYLAVDDRRLDAGNTWVPVREKTVLEVRCVAEGGVPPPELSWELLALEPALDYRPYLRIHPTNYSIEGMCWSRVVVTAARELHNATLQCTARQRRPAPPAPAPVPPAPAPVPPAPAPVPPAPAPAPPAPSPDALTLPPDALTAKLDIHVTYPPSFVISRWPGFGVPLIEGVAVALRCDMDANPPARVSWVRDPDNPSSSPIPLVSDEDGDTLGSATLRWVRLLQSHRGWYRCRTRWMDIEYSSIGYYLNVVPYVHPQMVPESEVEEQEPDHQKVEVPLGGNVQFNCPKGSVGCWWRRVVGNATEPWAPAGSHHAHGVLGIKEAMYEEGGEYRCVGTRAPDLKRLRELKRVTLRVTGRATATAVSAELTPNGWHLECDACGRAVRVLWLRDGHAAPAALTPGLAQHCWRAILLVPEPDEVWCIAATSSGGAVAVFPPRTAPASLSPARHAVRALHANAEQVRARLVTLFIGVGAVFTWI